MKDCLWQILFLFLLSWDNGTFRQQPHKKAWEHFTVISVGENKIGLKTHHGTYVSAWNDGTFRQQPHLKEWEIFTLITEGEPGRYSLKTDHGTWVSAWNDGTFRQQPHSREWEWIKFESVV